MFEEKFEKLGGVSPVKGDKFQPLTAEDINQVETSVNAGLPEDYKEFLRQYGQIRFNESVGFKPLRQEAVYPVNDETGETNPLFKGSQISLFFGKDEQRPASLLGKIGIYRERMPKSVIPIADDGLGNKICLGLGDENHGTIYWWDHENEWDEDDYEDETGNPMPEAAKYQNLYLLAQSFTDFVEGLYTV